MFVVDFAKVVRDDEMGNRLLFDSHKTLKGSADDDAENILFNQKIKKLLFFSFFVIMILQTKIFL